METIVLAAIMVAEITEGRGALFSWSMIYVVEIALWFWWAFSIISGRCILAHLYYTGTRYKIGKIWRGD
jgi:1,4-dihydroxy-2-naphthoate octaprenyltransferase